MLVYLSTRLTKIEESFWEFSNNLPSEYKAYLRNEEVQYFNHYKELIFNYQKSFDQELSLTKVYTYASTIYLLSFYYIYIYIHYIYYIYLFTLLF